MPQQTITAHTLVDITDAGSVKIRDANTVEYHQMQNLNVLLQIAGLRTQPMDYMVKIIEKGNTSEYNFDPIYRGIHRIWVLKFDIQHERVFHDGENELGLLESDADKIAITTDLHETAHFGINAFNTSDCVNLYFNIE